MPGPRSTSYLLLPLCLSTFARAATPSAGTLTDTSGPVTYTAGPFLLANPTPVPLVDVGPECNGAAQPCDDFLLTIALPSDYATNHPNDLIEVKASWTDTGAGASDYDLYLYAGSVSTTDGSQQAQSQSASSANPETARMRVFNGTRQFTVKVVPFTPTGETVSVQVSLVSGAPGPVSDPNFGNATPTSPGVPRYQNFFPPEGSAADGKSGEFSIGFNPRTGNILTLSDVSTFRVTPPEKRVPALPESGPALWTDVSPSIVSATTLDPILHTDQTTGRTFQSMQTTGAEALFAYSDDDGANWIQASVAPPNLGLDHQTIGSGPYPALFPIPNPAYPNAVYYCSQDIAGPANCQRSDTGGATFGPGIPIYEGQGITACGGLHGHVKVGPDGAVYVPVPQCGEQQGGVVSLDSGLTWTQYLIPGSQSFTGGSTDPSVAIDASNTAYQCYVNGTGPEHHVHVAVSHDHGATWVEDHDLGAAVGVVNAVFPEAVAGSAGRAACGFLGSSVAGDHESLDYPGIWYLFIATTDDGGHSWTTVNATPNDPVQGVGGIWNGGGGNLNRNLLDFNEITLDDHGRVLFGYDDGCVSGNCIHSGGANNDFVAFQRVARQTGGRPLLAQFDPVEPALAKAPYLTGTRAAAKTDLRWTAPDNGGSEITAYKIFRGTSPGSEALLATVPGSKSGYEDATVDPSVTTYLYQVVAVNALGDGPPSNEVGLDVTVSSAQDVCKAPGLTLLTDAAGDSLTMTPGTDLKSFQLSQPYSPDGALKLRFELDTDPGMSPQAPGSFWYMSFKTPDGKVRGVRMAFATSALLTPTFESYIAAPNSSGAVDGRFVETGSEVPADASSIYDAARGMIAIVVRASDLGLSPGDTLTGFNAGVIQSVQTPAGGAAESVDEMPDGLAYVGSDTVQSNDSCAPNTPPLAVLNGAPTSGTTPLVVSFDASSSRDVDPGDSVADYTFDFGDGTTPVTQSTPAASHTYANAGVYAATLTVTDTHGRSSQNGAKLEIDVDAFYDDGNSHLAYSKGWHTVSDADASGGTFHLMQPGGGGALAFAFTLGSAQGTLQYFYATDPHGGSADVYLDGVKVQTVSYRGSSGSLQKPVFGPPLTVAISGQGSHTFELRNLTGAGYVDKLVIAGSSSDAEPGDGPGTTTTSTGTVSAGQKGTQTLFVPGKAERISVVTQAASGLPYSLAVIDPFGNLLSTLEPSSNGVAAVDLPVTTPGPYVMQIVNLGIGPLQVWSAATPQLKR